jgi:hypothetical protein
MSWRRWNRTDPPARSADMTADTSAAKRRWAVAIAAALGLTAMVLLLFRVPRLPSAVVVPPRLTLSLGRQGSADAVPYEDAIFHQPRPLFLPTRWNSTPDVPRPEPDEAFQPLPPTLFATNELKLDLPAAVQAPANPVDALVSKPPGNPVLGFGRTDAAVPVLPTRGAFIEIVGAGTGTPVFSRALADARPPLATAWQPLEFVVEVDPAGLVGPPVLTVGSGVPKVDAYFGGSEGYLAQNLRVGDLLNPGFYRILVGP